MKLEKWSPTQELLDNPRILTEGLAQAFAEGDRAAFIEILQGWIVALNSRFTMDEITAKTGISRRTLYSLMKEDANPTADTVFSLVNATKGAA